MLIRLIPCSFWFLVPRTNRIKGEICVPSKYQYKHRFFPLDSKPVGEEQSTRFFPLGSVLEKGHGKQSCIKGTKMTQLASLERTVLDWLPLSYPASMPPSLLLHSDSFPPQPPAFTKSLPPQVSLIFKQDSNSLIKMCQ